MEELENHFDALLQAVNKEAENDNSEDALCNYYLFSFHQTGRFY